MQLKLVCRDPLASPRVIVVDRFPVELGRGQDVNIRIDDCWLSRHHCRIDAVDGMLQVRDLGSRHGTYVNGQNVTEAKLLPGDELQVGLTNFVAQYEPVSACTTG